jgi:hypothetical protein
VVIDLGQDFPDITRWNTPGDFQTSNLHNAVAAVILLNMDMRWRMVAKVHKDATIREPLQCWHAEIVVQLLHYGRFAVRVVGSFFRLGR